MSTIMYRDPNENLSHTIFMGIDVSKDQHAICCIDSSYRVQKKLVIPNRKKGFQTLESILLGFKEQGVTVLAGLESTGVYGQSIYGFLQPLVSSVSLWNPFKVEAYRKFSPHPTTKTDAEDAFLIACFTYHQWTHPTSSPINLSASFSKRLAILREYTRVRIYYTEKRSNQVRRLSTLVEKIFPEFFDVFTSRWNQTAFHLMRHYPSPEQLGSVPTQELGQQIERWSKKQMKASVAGELQDLAKNTIAHPLDGEVIAMEIGHTVELILWFQDQLKKVEQRILAMSDEFPSVKILQTIPGMSTIMAMSIVSEVEPLSRFSRVESLRSYAGMDPRIKESGKSVHGKSFISKKGSRYLRRSLYYAANSVRQKDPVFGDYYKRKRNPHHTHRYAVLSTANKLLAVVYALLKKKQSYQASYEWNTKKNVQEQEKTLKVEKTILPSTPSNGSKTKDAPPQTPSPTSIPLEILFPTLQKRMENAQKANVRTPALPVYISLEKLLQ